MARRRTLPCDEVLQVYLMVYRIAEIARWFKVDPRAVAQHARRLGFPPRPKGGDTRHMKDRPKPQDIAA